MIDFSEMRVMDKFGPLEEMFIQYLTMIIWQINGIWVAIDAVNESCTGDKINASYLTFGMRRFAGRKRII